MGEWRTVSLSELAEINPTSAAPLSRHTYIDYLDISSVGEGEQVEDSTRLPVGKAPSRAKRQVAHGDTLLSMVRPGRRSMLWLQNPSEETVASTGFLVLRAKNQVVDPRFLYYTVFNPTFTDYLVTRERGAAYPAVTATDVLSAKINVPPLMEQRKIASILGALDDKIELNRRMNTTLEAMARAIFQSWFVDFDPVHAKADGRQPVGMDAETAALFPDSFEDSALGPIPKGWAVTTVNQLLSLKNNRVEPDAKKDHLRYVALDDMRSKSICIDSFRAGSEVNSSIIEFSQGDVLFGSMRPYFHKVGLAPFDGITRTTTFVLAPKAEWIRHFGLFVLSTDVAIEYATSASIGTTIPYVTWDALGEYKSILPPEGVLKAFSKVVGELVAQMNVNILTVSTLTEMRDAQLPKLLSGELHVGSGAA